MLHVPLKDFMRISESSTDETFRIKDTVLRVHSNLIFGGIAIRRFRVGQRQHQDGVVSVALIVRNDFNTIISKQQFTQL